MDILTERRLQLTRRADTRNLTHVSHQIDPVRVVLKLIDRELLKVPASLELDDNAWVVSGAYQYDAGAVKLTSILRPEDLIAACSSFISERKFWPSSSAPPRSVPGYSIRSSK